MTELNIHDWPLPYEPRLAARMSTDIDMVVIHCTELPDLATAREYGERIRYPETQTGNSGHYYIDRDGSTHQFVSALRVAHHVFRYNPRSIGIELVNLGRYPDWNDSRHQLMTEPYPVAQIDALLTLLGQLRARFPGLHWIAGHDALDRRHEPASDDPSVLLPRRLDPGPMFPWADVMGRCGLARWAALDAD